MSSVFLSWSAPEMPNGEIIAYEVTYRIGSGDIAIVNATNNIATNFTITFSSPSTSTTVSNISVTAYTRAGRGETRTHKNVAIPDEVTLRKFVIVCMSSHSVLAQLW